MSRGSLRGGLYANAIRSGGAQGTFALAVFVLTCLAGAAQADGDAAKGKAAFVRQCAICHTDDKGGDNRFGPNLFGIVGKKAGEYFKNVSTSTLKELSVDDFIGAMGVMTDAMGLDAMLSQVELWETAR